MNATLSALADALEAERLRPTPTREQATRVRIRLDRAAACPPISAEQQARNRAVLLAALRNAA